MIFKHGILMDFVLADEDLDGLITEEEARDAGWARYFEDYDYEGDGYWDFLDYLDYVLHNMEYEEGWTENSY